ncbi:MAG: M24 family metallopeptidase [Gammaproteobacteria bacterium]
MAERYFTIAEYEERWRRVLEEMAHRGYEAAVIWGRSGGGYERCGDVLYLANYYSQASGQGWDNELFNARSFSAVIMQQGEQPELQADEPWPRKDVVSTDRLEWHHDPIKGVADALKRRGITGKVAFVGTQVLPMKYWLQLESYTSDISWEPADDLVLSVRKHKSLRELECMREAGKIMTKGLDRLLEGLIAGEAETVAAAAAAGKIIEAGGSIHMIPCSHGDMIQYWCTNQLAGYSQTSPKPGDLVRGWIYGPIREGYWLDPGRTAVCGGKPNDEQKALIEMNANVIGQLMDAVRPGAKAMDVARLGERLMQESGGEKDQAAEKWPHFGHFMGLFFELPYIGTQMCSDEDVFSASTVVGIEAFVTKSGVGSSGIEQNFIVHADHNEILTKTPVVWW